ncbi:DMT family transporter [Microbacterium deminutum]|uniref:DMT family transporter n=1 Tax=Microbacterium deminutum TaxID=344164 RepID=A0ABN2RB97_9MICO
METGADARARVPAWIVLGGAALVGVLTAVQARINGQLGIRLDNGLVAAAISFGSGLVILIVLSAFLPAGRRGFAALTNGLRRREIPWWMLAGGAAGALTVATQGLAVGVIGVSLFTVGVVAGQAMNGLILDRVGYGPAGVVAVTVPRVLGALLALTAVGLGLLGDGVSGIPLWMLVLPFAAGIGIAWQQATNGRLRQRVGTPLTATLVNFVGGTILLVLVAVAHVLAVGAGPPPTEPWLYLGGAIGVAYIILSAALVAYTGVLLLGLGVVVGQLLASVAIDALWPAAGSPGFVQEFAMVVVALLSVAVAAVPWRRRARR